MERLLQLSLAALLSAGAATSAGVTLVADGRSEAVIELEDNPTKAAQLGAFELQHHVQLITGATLPIAKASEKPGASVRIKIGGGNQDWKPGEKMVIKFSGNDILITGYDTPDYGPVDYAKEGTFPKYEYAYHGSLFAVYDFLENYSGVRFYFMDETGTTYTPRKTLTVEPRDYEHTPPTDAFRELNPEKIAPRFEVTARSRALWRFRWRQCRYYGLTNHNEYSIYYAHWGKAQAPKLAGAFRGERHDLFAHNYGGQRYGVDQNVRQQYPNDPDVPPHLCYSNPETVTYYAEEALTYLRGGTVPGGWGSPIPRFEGKPFFYPIQGSDSPVGHCQCERCREMFPNSTPDDISDNKYKFVSDVARELAKTDPSAGISTLGYYECYGYPKRTSLADNVSVELCPVIFSWWHPIARERQMAAYKEWMAKEGKRRLMTIWTYLYSGGPWDSFHHYGKYKPFPGVYPWKAAEIFRMFLADGVRGVFIENDVTYCGLEGYIALRLAYDPAVDTDKLIDGYFSDYYGAAGPAMAAFYRRLQEYYWNAANYPAEYLRPESNVAGIASPKGLRHSYWTTGLINREINWATGTPERVAGLNELIEQAKRLVRTPDEKKRLDRLVSEVWEVALAGRRDYDLVRKRGDTPLRALAAVRAGEHGGDPAKVDWNRCGTTPAWGDQDGLDTQCRCSAAVALDSKHLYIKLTDPAGINKAEPELWMDDFEIFAGQNRSYPFYQIALFHDGTLSALRYDKENGTRSGKAFDAGANVVNRTLSDGTWEVLVAVPLDKLGLADTDVLRINFMRASSKNGNAMWNPTYTSSFLDGFDNAGVLSVFPKTIPESGFSGAKISDPAARDGKASQMAVNEGWSVNWIVGDDVVAGRYRIVARLRSDVSPDLDLKHAIGTYDTKAKRNLRSQVVKVSDISGTQYRDIDLGAFDLQPGLMFYIGGIWKNTGLDTQLPGKHIFVDDIVLTPER